MRVFEGAQNFNVAGGVSYVSVAGDYSADTYENSIKVYGNNNNVASTSMKKEGWEHWMGSSSARSSNLSNHNVAPPGATDDQVSSFDGQSHISSDQFHLLPSMNSFTPSTTYSWSSSGSSMLGTSSHVFPQAAFGYIMGQWSSSHSSHNGSSLLIPFTPPEIVTHPSPVPSTISIASDSSPQILNQQPASELSTTPSHHAHTECGPRFQASPTSELSSINSPCNSPIPVIVESKVQDTNMIASPSTSYYIPTPVLSMSASTDWDTHSLQTIPPTAKEDVVVPPATKEKKWKWYHAMRFSIKISIQKRG